MLKLSTFVKYNVLCALKWNLCKYISICLKDMKKNRIDTFSPFMWMRVLLLSARVTGLGLL